MGIGLAQIEDVLAQALHHGAGADQLFHQDRSVRQFFAQSAVVQRHAAGLGGAFGQFGHPVGVEGLFQKVKSPNPHRFDRHGHIAVACDQNHRQARIHAHQLFQKRHAVHAGHFDVRHDHSGKVGPDHLQRLFGRGEGFRIKPRQGQPLADGLPHIGFVIHNRHFHRPRHATLTLLLSRLAPNPAPSLGPRLEAAFQIRPLAGCHCGRSNDHQNQS